MSPDLLVGARGSSLASAVRRLACLQTWQLHRTRGCFGTMLRAFGGNRRCKDA